MEACLSMPDASLSRASAVKVGGAAGIQMNSIQALSQHVTTDALEVLSPMMRQTSRAAQDSELQFGFAMGFLWAPGPPYSGPP